MAAASTSVSAEQSAMRSNRTYVGRAARPVIGDSPPRRNVESARPFDAYDRRWRLRGQTARHSSGRAPSSELGHGFVPLRMLVGAAEGTLRTTAQPGTDPPPLRARYSAFPSRSRARQRGNGPGAGTFPPQLAVLDGCSGVRRCPDVRRRERIAVDLVHRSHMALAIGSRRQC